MSRHRMHSDVEQLERRPAVPPRDQEAHELWHTYMEEASRVVADLPAAEREDVLLELASHVSASVSADSGGLSEADTMRAALQRLGSPNEFLRPMLADSLMDRGTANYHPGLLAKGLYHSLFGGLKSFTVALAFGLGYLTLAIFGVMALFKAGFPRHIGYFVYPNGTRVFGITGESGTARDILGYWIVPIAITVVIVLYVLLTRGLRSSRARRT
jgi:hypothetical protein